MFNGKLRTEELARSQQLILQISDQKLQKTKCDYCAFYMTVE